MLTGSRGMLGRTLVQHLSEHTVFLSDRGNGDITNAQAFFALMKDVRPDAVVHCAAMTTVDLCETKEDEAFRVNALGTSNVAAACYQYGARLLAVSTDYVFDGNLNRPYHEFDVPTGGINVYGQSKWAGEQAIRTHCPNHIIARTSWLYGEGGPSFVHTMLRLADRSQTQLKVVNDQVGNPTSVTAVAVALKRLIERPELVGTFHISCEGAASWCEFAREIFRLAGSGMQVISCTSEEYPMVARRPHNSQLEKKMLRLYGLPSMPNWKRALREFLERGRF